MRKHLALLAFLVAATPAFAAADKPLVIEGGVTKQLPANTGLQLNGSSTGAASINIPHGTAPSAPTNGDCWTTTTGLFCRINGSTVGPYAGGGVSLSTANTWTASQRGAVQTLSLSVATATPNFDTGNNFTLTLSSACPCTLANPSTTPVAGQAGVIEVIQDGTGSRTITTWGSSYISAGGTSTLSLSTAANARDYFSYYVADSTHIVLSQGAANASH